MGMGMKIRDDQRSRGSTSHFLKIVTNPEPINLGMIQ